MKKHIIRVAAMLMILCSAVASLRQPIVERLLALKAKEFITGDFIKTFGARTKYTYENGQTFDGLYQDVRTVAYEATFGKEVRETERKDDHRDDYYGYRTIAVSVFRQQLHQGNTLQEVYNQVRGDYIKAVSAGKAIDRQGLIKLLTRATETFDAVAKDSTRAQLVKSLSMTEPPDYASHCDLVLSKRLTPEQTVKAIGQPAAEVPFEKTERAVDPDGLKRFALRRFDEGGQKLVKKYQAVIALALADAKAADAAAGIEKAL